MKLLLFLFTIGLSYTYALQPAAEKIKEFDQTFLSYADKDQFSGVVGFVQNGKIISTKAYGLANRETNTPLKADSTFVIGSVTKQFVGTALILLIREGKVRLTDTIGDFLPTAPADKKNISLLQLASHTSGMSDCYYVFKKVPQDVLDHLDYENDPVGVLSVYLQYADLKPTPGFEYNNCGYTILAYVIEKASQMKYEDFMVNRIFRPAGMKDTGFCRHPATLHPEQASTGYQDGKKTYRADELEYDWNGWKGSDGVVSNATDMLQWLNTINGESFLTNTEKKIIFSAYSTHPGWKMDYGLGWMMNFDPSTHNLMRYGHSGGTPGFLTFYEYDVTAQLGVIYLSNQYLMAPYRKAIELFRK